MSLIQNDASNAVTSTIYNKCFPILKLFGESELKILKQVSPTWGAFNKKEVL